MRRFVIGEVKLMSIESIISVVSIGAAGSAIAATVFPIAYKWFVRGSASSDEDRMEELKLELAELLEHQKDIERLNKEYSQQIEKISKDLQSLAKPHQAV